jgi:hypothetical protein
LRRGEIGTERRRPKWLEFLVGPDRLASEYVQAHGGKVDEIMTPDPCSVTEDETLESVVDLMERWRIKRLPVVHGERLIGIVSRANLVRALVGLSRDAQAPAGDDAVITYWRQSASSPGDIGSMSSLETALRSCGARSWTNANAKPASSPPRM